MTQYSPFIRTFKEITEEFDFVSRNLNKKINYYKKLINKGYKIPSAGPYLAYSSLTNFRQMLELEINRQYTLELTSSFEAKVVYYFKYSLNKNRKNPFHKAYRNIVSSSVRNGPKHMMYQHLMNVFKDQIMPVDHLTYSQFKNLVAYRNWLAHGRGWPLPNHMKNTTSGFITDKFDYQYSYQVISSLIDNLPYFPNKLKE